MCLAKSCPKLKTYINARQPIKAQRESPSGSSDRIPYCNPTMKLARVRMNHIFVPTKAKPHIRVHSRSAAKAGQE